MKELLTNSKIAATVGATTATSGMGTILDLIPDNIGKLGTLVGIILSMVLIASHLMVVRKTLLEMAVLKEKEAERLDSARQRQIRGEPTRREDDPNPST